MSTQASLEKIIDLDVWHCQMPVTSRRDHGIGSVQGGVDVVVVRLTSESGAVGFGEASPWPVFCGIAEASVAAFDRYFRPHVVGHPINNRASIMRNCESAAVNCTDAKAALEAALLDLHGKILGVPAYVLLGGKVRDSIPLSVSIANPDFDQDLELAQRIYADGIRIVKVKTGFKTHEFDIHRIETLQKQFPEFLIRVDYNQGLQPFDAIRRVKDIDALNVSFIEQPVAAKHFSLMHAIKAAVDTPILADESVFSPSDMMRAIKEDICDAVSVKIMKSGGPTRGMEIASIAEAAGLAAYGGDMFETGLAHMAGVHMIAASPNISLGCEFYQATYYLQQDLLAKPFEIIDGCVPVPARPGLGITVDESLLNHFQLK